jgi:putative pyruvate formate lyase activating enzyme
MRGQLSEIVARAAALRELIAPCRLCPSRCGVDRLRGELGRCGTAAGARVAAFGAHFGEERPLVGAHGSGTVFFSGCNLSCLFCQNAPISQGREGDDLSPEELAAVFLNLQSIGCHNLNLVTPTHQAYAIVEALAVATARGLDLPVVWNCGGYESADVIEILDGIVDVYMPDFKYGSDEVARALSGVSGYTAAARPAVLRMHRQVGDLRVDEDGIARRGLLVRHLVLPGGRAGTESVVEFLAREVSTETYMNVMSQYHPCHRAHEIAELGRRITREEFRSAVRMARGAGLHRFAAADGRAMDDDETEWRSG